jgi:hypothetical protein
VSLTSINTQVTENLSEEKRRGNFFFRFVEKYGEQLDIIRFPNKVISTLLGWTEYMPLPSQLLSFLADRRHVIKTVTSTFALPYFFVKQIKLLEMCNHLNNRLCVPRPVRLDKIVDDVKKVFLSFLSAMVATLKVPQALDKTRIIDLSKISRVLPNVLAKGDCLLSLGLYSMKVIDTTWLLGSQLKRENRSLADWNWSSSSKVTKTLLKLSSNSLKVFSNSIVAMALFLGWYTNPLISVAVSSLSLVVSLIGKIGCHRNFFWKDSKRPEVGYAALPP